MTSIKVKFRPSASACREGSIYYQIIHERVVRQILTTYKIFPAEWNERRRMPEAPGEGAHAIHIRALAGNIRLDLKRLSGIVRRQEDSGLSYTADDVVEEFRRISEQCLFSRYIGTIISKMREHNRLRTAETYAAAGRSFSKYMGNRDIMLDSITGDTMEGYEAHLKSRGNVPNTTSFYMRILRAVYNRAVESGIIEDRFPFRHVYTGIDKTVKRALPIPCIKRINALDLSATPSVEFARDMFMMSFFLRGMSFIDMAFLRKSDLRHGYISYRRRKTGRLLTIAWTKEMQTLLAKYPENPTRYLLPIITRSDINEQTYYRNKAYRINHNLKTLASMAGLQMPVTLYCARHSWASVARAKGIPVHVISEGMGHDSEATTQIYLASLDNSLVDKANADILKGL